MRRLYEAAQYVVDKIESFGLAINPSSRIGQMRRMFCHTSIGPARDIPGDSALLPNALEAMRDARQLEFVLDSIDKPSNENLLRKVKLMLKDSVLPQDDLVNSKGRDTQAEFFVYAVCENAGLKPVFNESPDIRCVQAQQEFGLAVKRVKSRDHFADNIERGAQQVESSGLPGFVVVDTSPVFNAQNEPIVARISDDEFETLHTEALRATLKPFEEQLRDARVHGVRGIFFHDHQKRLDERGQWELASMHMMFDTCPKQYRNARRHRELNEFWNRYSGGLPNRPSA